MSRDYLVEKPAAVLALGTGRNGIIEASAGTGKTYTLEGLLVELLLVAKLPIDAILVVTFTEKATTELVGRVRSKLQRLLDGTEPAAAPSVPRQRCWLIDMEARELIGAALSSLDSARISTIHAFCQSVLTEHAFDHRRLFVQEQVPDDEAFATAFTEVLRSELGCAPALRPWLEAWLEDRDVAGLSELLRAVHRTHAEVRPVFDPARLVEALRAFPPASAVGDKALYKDAGRGSTPGTIAKKLVQLAEAAEHHREDPLGFVRTIDSLQREDKLLSYLHARLQPVAPTLAPARQIQRAFLDLADVTPNLSSAVAQLFLPRVLANLERRKLSRGQYDFHDMLLLVSRSLSGPGGEALISALRTRYRYALIDEFQDTDDVQWEIFKRIFFDSQGACPVVAIGDPKQAIYSFRGADVHVYHRALKLLEAGGRRSDLIQSFRATGPLIEACNLIFDQSASFFTGDIRYDHPVTCGAPDLAMVGADGTTAVSPICLLSPFPPGDKLPAAQVRDALGRRIASEIRAILDPDRPSLLYRGKDGSGPRPIKPREIFLLTRTNVEGERIGEYLRAARVPFAYYKQDGLFERPEAADVLDLLVAIHDPRDRSARARALIGPFFELTLAGLAALSDPSASHPAMLLLESWRDLALARRWGLLFSDILDRSGLVRRLLFFHGLSGGAHGERELTNYQHLFELLTEHAERSGATLASVIGALRTFIAGTVLPDGEDEGVQRLESERDAVQIMTIHKAKGLEAPVVFLYGGLTRRPGDAVRTYHDRQRRVACVGSVTDAGVLDQIEREEEQESQRLLYVALTRAMGRLYLPYYPDAAGSPGEERVHSFHGVYRPLNDRLRALLSSGRPEVSGHFVLDRSAADSLAEGPTSLASPVRWTPPEHLLTLPDASAARANLQATHRGFAVTSYTGLKAAAGGYHPPEPSPDDQAAGLDEGLLTGADPLPGGPTIGSFLHAVLEEVPLASLTRAESASAWADLPEVAEVVSRCAARHDLPSRQVEQAVELVHAALVRPVPLRSGLLSGGISSVPSIQRELEFLYPIPERAHPPLTVVAEPGGPPLVIERGFIKGFVDVVFEHEGLCYFVDWKSDRLPRWEDDAVAAHVARNYHLQAILYSLAMIRFLDVHDEASYRARFGGYLYCFLRGMRPLPPSTVTTFPGVYFDCPSWDEVQRWDDALRRGGALPMELVAALGRQP